MTTTATRSAHADSEEFVPRPRTISKAEGWRRRGPLLPAMVFAILVTQVPFLFTLYYSTQSWNLVRPGSQKFNWLNNYVAVFQDSQFREVALNTVIMIVGTVIISVVLGLFLALLLDRKFIGRSLIRTLLITPFLITPVAGALIWKTTMFDPVFGLINFALSPFWQWTPFMMLLILAGLQSMPKDIAEAARVDGAGPVKLFRELTLPHLRRFIELGAVLGAIYLVNTFDAVYMMTSGGPGVASANLPFYIYQRAFLGFDIGQAAAMGVVTVVATIIVSTLALRLIFKSFSGTEEAA
jgi:sorbitol/mannitol transport system permease protein